MSSAGYDPSLPVFIVMLFCSEAWHDFQDPSVKENMQNPNGLELDKPSPEIDGQIAEGG
jgi:hypothetical protein